MSVNLIIDRLLVFSTKNKKYFLTEFDEKTTIIYGKNTAGKSTVFQMIFYAFGINDNNDYLKEILSEEVIVRLDCRLKKETKTDEISFIRDGSTLYVKEHNGKILCFNGIDSNRSNEHIKLKKYINNIFRFTLKLESNGEYKQAPIETIFLPYYICQSVGWVYLMKSFNNLEYFKNFRTDYLDYYLGIENFTDIEEKIKLELLLKDLNRELEFYKNFKIENKILEVTKLMDEKFKNEANLYLESYICNQGTLKKKQSEYIEKCNELSYLKNRQALLNRVSKNHTQQSPLGGKCPVCNRDIERTVESTYKFLQEKNDTEKEQINVKDKIKKVQSKINSLKIEIEKYERDITNKYEVIEIYTKENVSFKTWIENKSNIELLKEVDNKVKKAILRIEEIKAELKGFKTEVDIKKLRKNKEINFSLIFAHFLKELNVKKLQEERYTSLYKISAFPYQGVELHKTVLSYNFAFNKLIASNTNIHRCPFMLDGIFKEDIDEENKEIILKFIGENAPKDTQLIISIAEIKKNVERVENYKKNKFNGKAKLISIGDGCKERAFLQLYNENNIEIKKAIKDTEDIIIKI